VARGARESVFGFFVVFSLFLNKNVFALDPILVVIYGVKFCLFS
jgi:hypothetical protein